MTVSNSLLSSVPLTTTALPNPNSTMAPQTATAGIVDPTMGGIGRFISGIMDIINAKPDQNLAQQIAGNATQGTNTALNQLAAFMSDPNAVTKMPGYEWGMNQANQGANRALSSGGFHNSGNLLLGLQDASNRFAGDWMDRMYRQLTGNVSANVAGGGLNLEAGKLIMGGNQEKQNDIAGGIGGIVTGLPTIWDIIGKLTGGGGGGGGSSGWTSGFDLPGGGDLPIGSGGGGWTSGFDLPGGGLAGIEPGGWTSGFDLGGA